MNLLKAASRTQMLPQLGSFRQEYYSLREESLGGEGGQGTISKSLGT